MTIDLTVLEGDVEFAINELASSFTHLGETIACSFSPVVKGDSVDAAGEVLTYDATMVVILSAFTDASVRALAVNDIITRSSVRYAVIGIEVDDVAGTYTLRRVSTT